MVGSSVRSIGAIVLLIASMSLMAFATPTAAQSSGSIEVHVSACPPDIGDRSLYDACHANGIAGDEIILDGPIRLTDVTSGDLGAVRFDGLPAGDYTIAEAQMTGDFSEYRVSCSDASGAGVPVDYRGNGRAAVAFTLGEGAMVTCDWYNLPAQERGITPTIPAESPSVTLPDTGTGPLGGKQGFAINSVVLLASAPLLVSASYLLTTRRRDSDSH